MHFDAICPAVHFPNESGLHSWTLSVPHVFLLCNVGPCRHEPQAHMSTTFVGFLKPVVIDSAACAQTRDESLVPLSINCWPSVSGGESYVNIEYEATADFDLQNVVISIPLPALSQAPRVPQARSLPGTISGVCYLHRSSRFA